MRAVFFRINRMIGHKTKLNKFKKIEIMQSIFSDHHGMKLEINNRRKMGKFTYLSKCNNTLNQWSKKKSQGK